MTAEDLAEGKIAIKTPMERIIDPKTKEEKIIYQYKISDKELGLLLLKYNRLYISKLGDKNKIDEFERRVKIVINSFNFADRSEDVENREKDFLRSCLAVSEKEISLAFFHGTTDVEKITNVHNLVCEKISQGLEGKETIREARKFDDMDVNLKREGRVYSEFKASYEYMVSCINDEGHFENFYKNLEGRMDKEVARKKIIDNFTKENGIQVNFLHQQSKYFDCFINFRLRADARLHNPANEKVI